MTGNLISLNEILEVGFFNTDIMKCFNVSRDRWWIISPVWLQYIVFDLQMRCPVQNDWLFVLSLFICSSFILDFNIHGKERKNANQIDFMESIYTVNLTAFPIRAVVSHNVWCLLTCVLHFLLFCAAAYEQGPEHTTWPLCDNRLHFLATVHRADTPLRYRCETPGE